VLISLFSLGSLLAVYLSHLASQPIYTLGSLPDGARGQGAGSCRMSYMSPSYVRLDGFGREYTRLGDGPWGLYLYREAGWDTDPFTLSSSGERVLSLQGTPVVFVPGNAGSFRQVRSLASAASRAWWELPGVRRKGAAGSTKEGGRSLDFFALDFNEDFSAFHGQTLRDQAEYLADAVRYVLTLYHAPAGGMPDPTSVMVVAHSMGGIVARAALLHSHYQANSISTMMTIASPHLVPPVTVDRGVDAVYEGISAYWRAGYGLIPTTSATSNAQEELANLVLVSIGGGVSDVTIASESSALTSLLPPGHSNGFAVTTTGIPGIWTPIDHLAILWCQQMMAVTAQALLSIVDVRYPSGVVPRAERVARLSDKLLGTLERPPTRLDGRTVTFASLEREGTATRLSVGERLVIRPGQSATARAVHLLPVPPVRTYGPARAFSLLTSAGIGRSQDTPIEVYACAFVDAGTAAVDEGAELSSPLCTALFPSHVAQIPSSTHAPVSPVLPGLGEEDPMAYVTVDVKQLEGIDAIAVVVKESHGMDWVVAEFGPKGGERVKVVDKTAFQLLLGGWRMEAYPNTPSLVSEVSIPALDTSLLVLKLEVFRSACQDKTALFAPAVRQYSPHVHESHFFPNIRSASIYSHAAGPYLPPAISPFAGAGTRLQFFLDPTCSAEEPVALELTVDLWRTLGALVMRYRMAMVTFPFGIVMIVVGRQLRVYNAGGSFMPFGVALSLFVQTTLAPLMALLTVLSLLQAVLMGTHFASSAAMYVSQTGQALHMRLPPAWMSNLLLGNAGAHWAGLAPFILFALVGAVTAEYLVLHALVAGAALAIRTVHRFSPGAVRNLFPLGEPRETLATQRLLSMGALLLLVLFFAPYQFAFLVIFLVHLFSTIRALLIAEENTVAPTTPAATKRAWDRYHYAFALLFVMTTLLPINALILVVWVRNLAVGWLAPFSSDHNVLNIVGFLLNVEALHSGKMLQRTKSPFAAAATTGLAWAAALFGLLYGIRYAHNIYPLTNAFFLWLASRHSSALVGAVHEAVVGKRRTSGLPAPRSDFLDGIKDVGALAGLRGEGFSKRNVGQ